MPKTVPVYREGFISLLSVGGKGEMEGRRKGGRRRGEKRKEDRKCRERVRKPWGKVKEAENDLKFICFKFTANHNPSTPSIPSNAS